MKCFNHPNRDVAATCVECGKGLCQECAEAFQPCLCSACASQRSKAATTGEIRNILVKSAIFFIISFVLFKFVVEPADSTTPLSTLLLVSFIFSGVPWGWSLLSRVFPIVVGGNIVFVVGFYLLKFIAAYFIGLIVMLWNILKICYLLIKRSIEKKRIQAAQQNISAPAEFAEQDESIAG